MTGNKEPYWEPVRDNEDRKTIRLPVPGGWLYYVIEKGDYGFQQLAHTLVFVPNPRKTP